MCFPKNFLFHVKQFYILLFLKYFVNLYIITIIFLTNMCVMLHFFCCTSPPLPHSLSHSLLQTHTKTDTHIRKHTFYKHTHTHKHSFSFCLRISLSYLHCFPLQQYTAGSCEWKISCTQHFFTYL